ncbi:GLPGLI family protein [Sphingobacterium detergens]|uniref:GLPGLI family protein n=2 Tax=Sphingobacterium detergens TaxID=1145106 RepID=A0A420AMD5_SPHD1|nr:GLPGLI family protein [Sphingobacterium detergens]
MTIMTMKKTFFTFILLAGSILTLKAQEKVIAEIHYQFKHSNDTSKTATPITDETVTYLGKESSLYRTYGDILTKQQIDAKTAAQDFDGNLTLKMPASPPVLDGYIINPSLKKTIHIEGISSPTDAYSSEAPYEPQNWEVTDETKTIGGYLCQKATCQFKGREYTAWFTTELPFTFGPWKLHGLPGLILSVHDAKNEVSWEYAGFQQQPSDQALKIEPAKSVIPAKKEEIQKLKKAFKDNPNAYYQSLAASGRENPFQIDYSKVNISFDFQGAEPSKQTNNPIELTP